MIDTVALTRISHWNPAHALDSTDPALEPYMPFTDKTEYIAWRTDWRRQYLEVSDQIRTVRTLWRAEGSSHSNEVHYGLFNARALARSMLVLRKASKVKSESLYQMGRVIAEVV